MARDEIAFKNFKWVDIEKPSECNFEDISEIYNIPLRPLYNCLDPELLPRFEKMQDMVFIILRVPDPQMSADAETLQEITTKIAVFIKNDLIMTIHRQNIDFINEMKSRCSLEADFIPSDLLRELLTHSMETLEGPLNELEHMVEEFESFVYDSQKSMKRPLRTGYFIKRKASTYKKILKLTVDILNKIATKPDLIWNDFIDLKEYLDRLLFYADDVLENITGLMNLQVSLDSQKTNEASYKTNEIMRVLTIFSIFFLPLNFIAGIYGMNFENMPELKYEWGYEIVLAVMLSLSIGIFSWVYKKGWLKKTIK